jgi:hypothetical protein
MARAMAPAPRQRWEPVKPREIRNRLKKLKKSSHESRRHEIIQGHKKFDGDQNEDKYHEQKR